MGIRVLRGQPLLYYYHFQSHCCKIRVEAQIPVVPHYWHCGWRQRQILKGHEYSYSYLRTPGRGGGSPCWILPMLSWQNNWRIACFCEAEDRRQGLHSDLPVGNATAGEAEPLSDSPLRKKRGPPSSLADWHHCARELEHCLLLLWGGGGRIEIQLCTQPHWDHRVGRIRKNCHFPTDIWQV